MDKLDRYLPEDARLVTWWDSEDNRWYCEVYATTSNENPCVVSNHVELTVAIDDLCEKLKEYCDIED